jgi:hypothetical protein
VRSRLWPYLQHLAGSATDGTGWNGKQLTGSVQLRSGFYRWAGRRRQWRQAPWGARMAAMNSTVGKFWQAAHHMIEMFVDRLPALLVAVVVFIAFYAFSLIVDRVIRRSAPRARQNLGVVFARLAAGATILLGFLVAFSIVAPSGGRMILASIKCFCPTTEY